MKVGKPVLWQATNITPLIFAVPRWSRHTKDQICEYISPRKTANLSNAQFFPPVGSGGGVGVPRGSRDFAGSCSWMGMGVPQG